MDFDPGMQGLWHNNICNIYILKSTEKKNNNTTNDNHVNSKISKLQICTALFLCSVTDIITPYPNYDINVDMNPNGTNFYSLPD